MSKSLLRIALLAATSLSLTYGDTLEENIARGFAKGYRQNEVRLTVISEKLESLPRPYLREPTGTGGFLSSVKKNADDQVVIRFLWDHPVEVDAIALFPLRLFMDEIYGDNLYWPEHISIEAKVEGEGKRLAELNTTQPLNRQSLPEVVRFDPVSTANLAIRCSGLQQHPHENWYAAGFAEICIFSGAANVAPQATVRASNSRQGYYVLAQEFLTDAQTPLGLPERSSRQGGHRFIKKIMSKKTGTNKPYTFTLLYPHPTLIDTVRIDPAIEHSYGQGFPVRFTIDLLDAEGRIIQSDKSYEEFPLRNPGLNPHYSYFPETTAHAVRLNVLTASQPVPKAMPTIVFSEITAMHQGAATPRATAFAEQFRGKEIRLGPGVPPNSEVMQMLASANDGKTHAGQVLPLRQWTEDLVRRQELLEEQLLLQNAQKHTLVVVQHTLVQGSLALLILGIGSSVFFVARNRIHSRKEVRIARAKMASDLHDDVGSNLGAIVLHVEKLQEQIDTSPERKRLKSIYRLTRESVFGLREVLRTTAPEVGRAQDIIAYMQELAGLLLGKTDFTFKADPSINQTLQENAPLQKGLLLFYKEAIHNAKTHSQCDHVDISFTRESSSLVLRIKDNGIGIDKQSLNKPRTLRTLKQRADWLQANLKIESIPGTGTGFTLSITDKNPHRSR